MEFQPTPSPIADDEVYIRASFYEGPYCEVLLRAANGVVTLKNRLQVRPYLYPIRLPAGVNKLDVRVVFLNDQRHGGALEDWEVDLPGGREYRLACDCGRDIAAVWIEDARSGQLMTEKRKLSITWDSDLDLL